MSNDKSESSRVDGSPPAREDETPEPDNGRANPEELARLGETLRRLSRRLEETKKEE